MQEPAKGTQFARFGAFEVNFVSGELRKHGVRLKVQEQPFQVLQLLLARPGELVTRETIQQKLWPSGTFVDFENGLNTAINRLREALGDSAENPRFIVTEPRRGYRFIAPVDGRSKLEPDSRSLLGKLVPNAAHSLHRTYRNVFTALVILAVVVGGFVYLHRAPRLTDKDTILLADFVNTTGEPLFDGVLKQALATNLQESPFLSIFSQENTQRALTYMRRSKDEHVTGAVAQEICERYGIKALIGGEISHIGARYVLNVFATNCLTGDTLAQAQAQATSKEQVLPALSDATRKIRAALGESLVSIKKFDAPIFQATTESLEALQAYTVGEEKRSRENDLAAIPFYQRAIEIDPDFVTAYALLGAIYQNTGDHRRAVEYQTKAFERRDRTSQLERFYITAHYYGDVTGEVAKEIVTYELWREAFPRDYSPVANLGETYLNLGDPERGLSLSLEALTIAPYDQIVYMQATQAFGNLNRFEEAKSTARKAITHGIDAVDLHEQLYFIAFAENDTAEMQRQMDWAHGRLEEWQMLFNEALAAGAHGKAREFRRLSQQAYDGALRQKSPGFAAKYAGVRASEEMAFGYPSEARHWATEALRLSQNELGWSPAVLALAGDVARADVITNELTRRRPTDTLLNERDLPQVQAAISISRGDGAAAVDALQPTLRYAKTTVTPTYYRGLAYLQLSQGKEAEAEFQQIINRTGVLPLALEHSMAHLQIGRAYAMQGDTAKAKAAYQDFLTLWKDADPDVPILIEAKAEYAKLH